RAAWLELDRAVSMLEETGSGLEAAQSALEEIQREARRQVVSSEGSLDYAPLRPLLALARARRAGYLAEALWRQAELEQPAIPDRREALRVLREAAAGLKSPELSE